MPLSSVVTLVSDRLVAADIAALPPVDAVAPSAPGDIPHITVSRRRCRAGGCAGSASSRGHRRPVRCGSTPTVDLADPVLHLAGENVTLLSANRRVAPAPARRSRARDRATTSPPYTTGRPARAPRGDDVRTRAPGTGGRAGATRHPERRRSRSRRRCRPPDRSSWATSSGSGRCVSSASPPPCSSTSPTTTVRPTPHSPRRSKPRCVSVSGRRAAGCDRSSQWRCRRRRRSPVCRRPTARSGSRSAATSSASSRDPDQRRADRGLDRRPHQPVRRGNGDPHE